MPLPCVSIPSGCLQQVFVPPGQGKQWAWGSFHLKFFSTSHAGVQENNVILRDPGWWAVLMVGVWLDWIIFQVCPNLNDSVNHLFSCPRKWEALSTPLNQNKRREKKKEFQLKLGHIWS